MTKRWTAELTKEWCGKDNYLPDLSAGFGPCPSPSSGYPKAILSGAPRWASDERTLVSLQCSLTFSRTFQNPEYKFHYNPLMWERIVCFGGAWVVQSFKHLSLGLGSGQDLRIVRQSPVLGSALSVESAWVSFSLCLCPSSPPNK